MSAAKVGYLRISGRKHKNSPSKNQVTTAGFGERKQRGAGRKMEYEYFGYIQRKSPLPNSMLWRKHRKRKNLLTNALLP
jgi:hypothetical protein